MNETEWDVKEVTVPWMNVRMGRWALETDADMLRREDVDDEGVSGGLGILVGFVSVGVGVEPEPDPEGMGVGTGSGGSSIFVYGIKALAAWSGNIENRGKTYTSGTMDQHRIHIGYHEYESSKIQVEGYSRFICELRSMTTNRQSSGNV